MEIEADAWNEGEKTSRAGMAINRVMIKATARGLMSLNISS